MGQFYKYTEKRAPTMLRLLLIVLVILPGVTFSDDRLTGVWESENEDLRLDILDGFKPNRGAILAIENDVETNVGFWETKESDTSMRIGWSSGAVRFRGSDSFEWNYKIFKKREGITEDDVVVLKEDESGFIGKLSENIWLTSEEGKQSVFKSTFSTDSGVVERYSKTGDLDALDTWGVSSGVLKIGNVVIVEARVSKSYMVGLDHRDEFVVFRVSQAMNSQSRTDLSKQRSEFLTALVTDTWQELNYGRYTDHKFRPVEGQLKGRKIHLTNNKIGGVSTWEYSPATGVLKIGYYEYIGGMVIGDTLALLEKDGDQTFYKRKPKGTGKVFSVSDVKAHRIDESRGNELSVVLSGQFQAESYLYSFEFNEDDRTGFVHKWRSIPFTITGHGLLNDLIHETETIYAVEEFLIFNDHFILKRDATASRLRTKSETEVIRDQRSMERKLEEVGQTRVILRVTDTKGEVQDITLPFVSMAEIVGFQILTE